MRNGYEARARKFIEKIYPFICECEEVEEYEDSVAYFNMTFHRNVRVAHGLTRVAFITSDYVVKVNCGSRYDLSRWGTCNDEVVVYDMARKDGFEYLFAKPTMFEFGGLEFCIMPLIRGIGKYEYDVYEYLGSDELDWIDEHIMDLHNRNYGWKNGQVVIFDYAARLQ